MPTTYKEMDPTLRWQVAPFPRKLAVVRNSNLAIGLGFSRVVGKKNRKNYEINCVLHIMYSEHFALSFPTPLPSPPQIKILGS